MLELKVYATMPGYFYYLIRCVYMYVPDHEFANIECNALRGHRKVLCPLEVEFQVAVSHLMYLLGATEP